MIEKLYTVEEVAEMASVTGRTIRNYLKSGKLVGRKIGGQWRFPESEVQRLLTGEEIDENENSTNEPQSFKNDAQNQNGNFQSAPSSQPTYSYANTSPSTQPINTIPEPMRNQSQNQVSSAQNFFGSAPSFENSSYPQPQNFSQVPVAPSTYTQIPAENQTGTPQYSNPFNSQPPTPSNFTAFSSAPYEQNKQGYTSQPTMPYNPYQQQNQTYSFNPNSNLYNVASNTSAYTQGYQNLNFSAGTNNQQAVNQPYFNNGQPTIPQNQFVAPAVQPSAYSIPNTYGNRNSTFGQPAAEQAPAYTPAPPTANPANQYFQAPAESTMKHSYTEPVKSLRNSEDAPKSSALTELLNAYATQVYEAGASLEKKEDALPKQETTTEQNIQPVSAKPKEELVPQTELSEVGKQVTGFLGEVHDCSAGPQVCAIIDLYQSLESAKITSQRLTEMAETESENGIACNCFVEFDSRYFVARYTIFGSSYYLAKCIEYIG